MKALAPARVREVRIHPDTGTAEVIVPDFQLSLAIGKEGQNARLAARLTGWRVDIKSEAQLAEEESGGGVEYAEGEWVENESGELVWQPAEGGDAISAAEAGYAEPFAAGGPAGAAAEAGAPAEGGAPATDGPRPSRARRRSAPRPRPRPRPPRRTKRPPRPERRRRSPRPPRPPRPSRPPRQGPGPTPRPRARKPVREPGRSPARRSDPVRTCVGCRRRGSPDSLVRIARGHDGRVRVGRDEPGRGAWLCADRAGCLDLAVRRRAIERALRIELSEEELTTLRVRLYGAAPEGADPDGEPSGRG